MGAASMHVLLVMETAACDHHAVDMDDRCCIRLGLYWLVLDTL